ncbi:MAG: SusD/RagB family nutrient-binding outer membrane lipoprotein [Parafilimonas sp.]|nr:SusD/RagB family nutrient-binding outer membrane lipoprotein [Parafilimonas sp.]
MKQYKFLIAISMVCVAVSSCKKDFFTGINTNPNASENVTPNLLLPTVEGALGYVQGGDFSRYSSMLDQQVYGYQNQTASFYLYQINSGNFDNQWGNMYTSVMENNYTLLQESDANGYNIYSGISRIIMAYCLQLLVDNWGDVPYSQAFQANKQGTLTPAYDNAQALYDTINNLIDAGINNFSADPGIFTPGADDYIYGGNTDEWIKFGHAIKARLAIHQSKNDAAMASNALSEISKSFTSNSDNAQIIFGVNQTEANPWYQFGRDRQSYITFSNSTLAGILTDLNDPRYSIYIDPDNDGGGQSPSGTYFGGLPDYYGAVNSPVELITYDELLFVKAEATLRSSGDIATAQTFYQDAIRANMQKLGVADADINTYIAANGTLPESVSDAIAKVSLQEYIALYLNPEAFTLWRRTGSPNLDPAGTGDIPRRLIYPLTETQYNPNTPQSTLYTPKIFWDK